MTKVRILFYGDPHGQWRPLLAACKEERPDAVVILGDCDLAQPLSEAIAPLLEAEVPVHWIPGNHDSDRSNWFDHLFHGGVPGNLHGRTTEVAGTRIAGLGGTFRASVWHPHGSEDSRFHAPQEYLAHLREQRLLDGRERLAETVIFPSIYDDLANESAQVLVTHEAPSCHRHGFEELDLLAETMGAMLIVHGHHHEDYEARLPSGIQVIGLGRAQPRLIEITPAG
ncbi:metallophosphoesterase family protein [Aquibaculum arenosum]|uniref:Metallophosphoesterase n=1 Tax=Aquibaculum arenosum TaxID=3032591 RepID=A0ABT5YM56_9PROT|nr:metallophosphoesterase [Fodinicurvata sp. CAU 1616]MDF2095977.1 metallophosphoesterase [Fodinicurvata sp. CAU 1616]